MGFWFFMFAVELLIPMIMFAAGKSFQKSAPKKIKFNLRLQNGNVYEKSRHMGICSCSLRHIML